MLPTLEYGASNILPAHRLLRPPFCSLNPSFKEQNVFDMENRLIYLPSAAAVRAHTQDTRGTATTVWGDKITHNFPNGVSNTSAIDITRPTT